YFTARDADGQQSLWMSDGSAIGTRLVRPADGKEVSNLTVSGPRLFFTTCSRDGKGHCELWALDLG
ncbi:MAG TPA: hyalin, partial [Vicinamibacteria bacterium]